MSIDLARAVGHLRNLTDAGGLYEHAEGAVPRLEHGYCVDDVARALVVTARDPDLAAGPLLQQYLDFVLLAQSPDGRFRNRRDAGLRWSGQPSVEDVWGRALWGLGTVAGRSASPVVAAAALEGFTLGAAWTSPWSRAMSFAALGAGEVHRSHPGHPGATGVLEAAAALIGRPVPDPRWPWPEARLSYANAALPEALLAAGEALDRPELVADGLHLLGWLLELQTRHGRLSVVPVGGQGPDDARVARFDQQPIEVAALADACARAYTATGDPQWSRGVTAAAEWFAGGNDAGIPLQDNVSGGGCDGLHPWGRNANQGAESTLALISTLQQARRLGHTP